MKSQKPSNTVDNVNMDINMDVNVLTDSNKGIQKDIERWLKILSSLNRIQVSDVVHRLIDRTVTGVKQWHAKSMCCVTTLAL